MTKHEAIELYNKTHFVAGDDILLKFKLKTVEGTFITDPSVFQFKAELNSNGTCSKVDIDDVVYDGDVFYIKFNGADTSNIWNGSYNCQLKIVDTIDNLSYVVWKSLFYLSTELVDW